MRILFCIISCALSLSSIFAVNPEEAPCYLADDFYLKAKTNPSLLESNSVVLFTNARNEKNMKEWAAHHLLLGFDIIYIFDHKSDQPLLEEFENFDSRVIVERCEWENPVKMPLMNRAASITKKLNASWMLYLDADEFLVLNHYSTIKELGCAFPHADSVGINWLLFGSNHHINEPQGLILENYTRSDLFLNQHVKSLVRPTEITDAVNPHYYWIKNPMKMYSISNQIINQKPYFNRCEIEYFNAPAYIAHYIYQSEETYIKRKINLPRDDIGEFRGKIPNIHLEYNDIENLEPKIKYSNQVMQFLKDYEQN